MISRAEVCVHVRTCVHPLAQNCVRTPDLASYIFLLSWSNAPTAQADSCSAARACTHMYACTHTAQNGSKANTTNEEVHP